MSYTDENRKSDFDFFIENYQDLYKKYGHKFLAIKNKNIIGNYDSFAEAVQETRKTFELGTFIVEECNGDESGYTNFISSWQLI